MSMIYDYLPTVLSIDLKSSVSQWIPDIYISGNSENAACCKTTPLNTYLKALAAKTASYFSPKIGI